MYMHSYAQEVWLSHVYLPACAGMCPVFTSSNVHARIDVHINPSDQDIPVC